MKVAGTGNASEESAIKEQAMWSCSYARDHYRETVTLTEQQQKSINKAQHTWMWFCRSQGLLRPVGQRPLTNASHQACTCIMGTWTEECLRSPATLRFPVPLSAAPM